MSLKYEFCRSTDSQKVHIRAAASTGRPACGSGSYGWSSAFKTLTSGQPKYPKSRADLCKHCRTLRRHGKFLIEVGMKDKPDAVTSCIYVDVHLPTKTLVPLSEASAIMKKISAEIERFTAIDIQGVCVKFNLMEY